MEEKKVYLGQLLVEREIITRKELSMAFKLILRRNSYKRRFCDRRRYFIFFIPAIKHSFFKTQSKRYRL